MSKLNAKLFIILREKAAAKFPKPVSLHYSERRKLRDEALAKAVGKATKEELKQCILKERCAYEFFKVPDDFEQPDVNKKAREALIRKIDEAELRYLAGDSEAALALINDVL